MRQSAGRMFVKGFFKSFLIILSLSVVGILSYQTVMYFFVISDDLTIIKSTQVKKVSVPVTEVSIDDISKNLIYCANEETGEISKILLEIYHCENKMLYYITIPVRTQFTMSDSLYQRLITVHPAMPQIVKLSGITKYFEKDTVYDYGVLMVEDLLNIEISYYTAIPQSIYQTMFVTEELKPEELKPEEIEQEKAERKDTARVLPKEIFSEEYTAFLKTIQTPEELSKYMEGFYPTIQSNLSLFGKMNYFDSYCNTPRSNVFYELIGGTNHNSAFTIDKEQATQQLKNCNLGIKLEID